MGIEAQRFDLGDPRKGTSFISVIAHSWGTRGSSSSSVSDFGKQDPLLEELDGVWSAKENAELRVPGEGISGVG